MNTATLEHIERFVYGDLLIVGRGYTYQGRIGPSISFQNRILTVGFSRLAERNPAHISSGEAVWLPVLTLQYRQNRLYTMHFVVTKITCVKKPLELSLATEIGEELTLMQEGHQNLRNYEMIFPEK